MSRQLEKVIHIRLSTRVYEALQRLSYVNGYPMTWLIRHATQKYLQSKGELK